MFGLIYLYQIEIGLFGNGVVLLSALAQQILLDVHTVEVRAENVLLFVVAEVVLQLNLVVLSLL